MGCYGKPCRTDVGRETLKSRQDGEKEERAQQRVAAGLEPMNRNTDEPPPPVVSGKFYEHIGDVDGKEWVMDCGCSFEMACWAFFLHKHFWGVHVQSGEWELMPHLPVYPREFMIQNMSNFAMIEISQIMNWRGTGFWDRDFHIRMRKTQITRFEHLVQQLEKAKRFDEEKLPGWPNVRGRINGCATLDLH
ncbi:hypothetical protein BDN72DRAFT_907085 [Pluteus cervinus]|uniref:Uncharacterized protein n=1 Tax=Pluteus cervinus TaxID=181527 RepID=A0ACD2ZXQ8_9AGAR|nr:hypothetical protein BDN72DRAFT_907085 [Pluteus cervinus]